MIIIHAAANESIGIGHLSRVNSLGLALKEKGIDSYFIFESSKRLVEAIFNSHFLYSIVENREQANLLIARKVLSSNDQKKIYITDLLGLDKEHKKYIKSLGVDLLIQLNDSNRQEYLPDVWVNGDAFNAKQINNFNTPIELVGAKYAILKSKVSRLKPKEPPKITSSPKKILISFGGADPGKYTEFFIENICARQEQIHFKVVIGPAFIETRLEYLNNLAISLKNVEFIYKSTDLTTLLIEADAFISLGGISAYESMCLGCPVLALEWEGMAEYVQRLEAAGFLFSLGDIQKANSLFKKVISNVELMNIRAIKAWEEIDGNGAKRVADFIKICL